jgi:hypothetical protein
MPAKTRKILAQFLLDIVHSLALKNNWNDRPKANIPFLLDGYVFPASKEGLSGIIPAERGQTRGNMCRILFIRGGARHSRGGAYALGVADEK